MRRITAGVIALSGLLGAQAVSGQAVTLDEGSFRLLVRGQESGTETFSIRRNGTGEGAVVIAAGRVVSGGQEINTQLQTTGSALRPTAYEIKIQGPDAQQIAGRVVGNRFSARISSAAGEMMREYPAGDGAVVVDDGLAHQYWFLAQRVSTQGGRVPVIVPRLSRQVTAVVTNRGAEPVTVGGTRLSARRLVVEMQGLPERHVWVDDSGRVLRLEIPSRNFVAERAAAPR